MRSIIIIGGGAAGLMTAYRLSKNKHKVILLEAKSRLGGRIATITNSLFSQPVELGAEFIHGDLPVTLSLLKEAGIGYKKINDTMFRLENGKLRKQSAFTDNWDELMQTMKELQHDISLSVFLQTYFSDEKYATLRSSIKGFAGGFDLADAETASTKALYREWSNEMENQYRPQNGYKTLIDFLETECRNNGCDIERNCCVKKISWQQNEINVLTMCSRIFKAEKAVVAVPLSVLQAENNTDDYIEFNPSISKHIEAAKQIGFGSVVKVLLEFTENFWQRVIKNAEFILTDEAIPTWWTQLSKESCLLTGWAGGEKANSLKFKTDDEILETALQSLSKAFAVNIEALRSKLKTYRIANWNNVADIHGGYSYNTIQSVAAKKILREPVNDTLFFTGEALFEGYPGGTVEAALSSANDTAELILKYYQS